MKVWKRLSGALLTASLLTGPSLLMPIAQADTPNIDKSVVVVGMEWTGVFRLPDDTDGTMRWSKEVSISGHCTGFFVGTSGEIATAGHCVSEEGIKSDLAWKLLDTYGTANMDLPTWHKRLMDSDVRASADGPPLLDGRVVEVVQPQDVDGVVTKLTTVQVVGWREFADGDVALLRIPNMSKPTPALEISDKQPAVGDEITSIGFPGSVADLVDVSRLRPSNKRGTVSSIQSTEKGVSVIEIDADVSKGMSGGPAINAAGEVVGLNSFGNADEPQSFNFITDGGDLKKFLISNGVTLAGPTEPTGPSHGTQSSQAEAETAGGGFSVPPWAWVVALIVVAGIIGAIAMAAKRRNPASARPAQVFSSDYPQQPYQQPYQQHTAPVTAQLPPACPGCGRAVPPDAAFCQGCGYSLS